MGLANTSLVTAAEELRKGTILSTDQRDSQTYCWKNPHFFTSLLTPYNFDMNELITLSSRKLQSAVIKLTRWANQFLRERYA